MNTAWFLHLFTIDRTDQFFGEVLFLSGSDALLKTKVRIAILVAVVVGAAADTFTLSKRIGDSSESSDASASSTGNIPAAEPTMTTESVPRSRQEGLQPPPSDVVGISKPEREPRR